MRPATAAIFGLVLCAAPAAAQESEAISQDPLFSTLFAPELIMQHRRAIGLTDEQRDAISQMIQDLQGRVVRLQWELLDEVQGLTDITSAPRVDLDRSLDQLGSVLDTEADIKRAHLEMPCASRTCSRPSSRRRSNAYGTRGPARATTRFRC